MGHNGTHHFKKGLIINWGNYLVISGPGFVINRKVRPKKKKSKISKKAEILKIFLENVEFQFALVNRLHRITPILTINEGISSTRLN